MAKILSIEIDNFSIKIIECIKKGEILSISSCTSINIPSGVADGKIIDMDLIVNLINESLTTNIIKTKKAVLVINSDTVITRKIKLPLLKKKSETISMIRLELEQLVSADLSLYAVVYKTADISVDDGIKNAIYVIYCLPIILFNQYKELARRLKLKLISIDVSYNCLNKIYDHGLSVNNNVIKSGGIFVFVNLGLNTISFCVVKNGITNFSRISYIEFEKDFIERVAETPLNYSNSICVSAELMHGWLDEISKYIRYYYSLDNVNYIDKIYIYGAYSQAEGFQEYLSVNLNCDVEIINKLSNVKLYGDYINGNFEIHNYFVSVLALIGDKRDVNFLTEGFKQKFKSNFRFVVALTVLTIFISAYYAISNFNGSFKKEIETMSLFLNNKENVKINAEIENLKNEVIYLEEYIEQIKMLKIAIKNDDYVCSEIFKEILNAIPRNTKVISVSVDKNNTVLQCVSTSMVEVTLFMHNLRVIDFIESIYMPSVAVKQELLHNYSYSVVCKFKDVSNFED
ncbi:MAG: pilus assembly protein PilM [Sedimentibacter sp.]|uniref:pilus assembly protein PilM n=1 Tax=Sedimentibacter sp. TaxID=1960295 RepID=UPI0029822A8E|nr:pilus assembly protein PilM [Sedimentibacter sp.]MDW5300397.1 pilus assembly protein PilM [Sedimentibacter sp.]